MEKGYLTAIETLGNALLAKDLEISLLKYENEKLEAKIKSIEEYCDFYKESCENVNVREG